MVVEGRNVSNWKWVVWARQQKRQYWKESVEGRYKVCRGWMTHSPNTSLVQAWWLAGSLSCPPSDFSTG